MPDDVIMPGDVFQTRIRGSYYGERFENVLHSHNRSSGPFFLNEIATGTRNSWCAQLAPLLSKNVKWDLISICRVSPSPKGHEYTIPITPLTGSNDFDDLPAQICYLLKIYTQVNARHRKGRMYIPGVTRLHFANNSWTNMAIQQMASIRQIFINQFSDQAGQGGTIGVFSRGDHDTNYLPMTDIGWSAYPCVRRSRRPHIQ